MPGNVQSATVSPTSTVFPLSLSTSFVEIHSYPVITQSYHDGTVQNSLITDGLNSAQDLRIWRLAKRLTVAQLSTLYTFFKTTVQGGYKPFYMYDPYAVLSGHQIGSNYDATGISTQGRYTVFFRGSWNQSLTLGRTNVPGLTLVQTA